MNCFNIKYKWMIQAVVYTTLIFSTQVFAGNSWFNKGSELLKSFGTNSTTGELTVEEIGAGLKEALKVGSKNVVKQLGAEDGFNKDSNIHIPLPQSLDSVKSMLDKVGMSSLFEDLELKLNRAAENATPKAKKLFRDAISDMSFEDVKQIYNGPDDAATQYFKEKMAPDLALEMKPVIETSLSQVGAVRSYDNMMKSYKSIPFVPDVKANLSDHVIEKGMDGIFYYMAQEEVAIRQNPAKRTTELLKKVFTK
ncbi:MAG: DUF4197 domain-containing protein [Deltaproteobacteria bacterium]|jgi:hypothetical protein|nr:DUF4197 domain-containing protein [Deltaproteobacteria bacterium]